MTTVAIRFRADGARYLSGMGPRLAVRFAGALRKDMRPWMKSLDRSVRGRHSNDALAL
jgi:hypothetical protein